MASGLSLEKCILLTVHYASEGNISALHSFTPSHQELVPELILRILLTYLPESFDPTTYITYVGEVASRLYLDVDRHDVAVDVSPVADISEEKARKMVKRLRLLEIMPPSFPPHAPEDLLTRFLCHRAYRVDAETGLLNLVPKLVEPFLDRNEYLRTWYISVVLPLLRLRFDYYPRAEDDNDMSLTRFEMLDGEQSVNFLLAHTAHSDPLTEAPIARDIRGLVGPWMYGHTDRKRRRLQSESEASTGDLTAEALRTGERKIGLNGVSQQNVSDHDWQYLYRWMVLQSQERFPLVTHAIEDWNGPSDVDLGGFNLAGGTTYLDESVQSQLEAQYAQAAFATCYAVDKNTLDTIQGAHVVLARLASLLDFIPPPDLATSVASLPKIERHAIFLSDSSSTMDLSPQALLQPEHPLTTPRLETYMLLQMIVYSAYQFAGLGYPMSLLNVTKLHFYATAGEQAAAFQNILRSLGSKTSQRDEDLWQNDRAKLIWLWNWGIEPSDEVSTTGAGVLGRIPRQDVESELLKAHLDTGCYNLAIKSYLKPPTGDLQPRHIEDIVLAKVMEAYDGASNGNRTRGGMKKANEILSAFRPYFGQSVGFRQANALITATHALSFYSLTLQHGVPFQPVSIRVSQDPIELIGKVLEQNPGSYTKLDDLVSIGRNFVSAGLTNHNEDRDDLAAKSKEAERRITFMAIEAALHEDDFETAYSYVVNRLSPSSASIEASRATLGAESKHKRNTSKSSTRSNATEAEDDTSWRAAFLAGRYRSATPTTPSLRRLEQRTELLSLALLLAPVSSLTEILAAWRRCEEETRALQLSQQEADEQFDDRADKRQSTSSIPGNFTVQGDQPALVYSQQRREMGRMTGRPGNDDAPISMFDLTRSAAQALSKNAFPLRAGTRSPADQDPSHQRTSIDSVRSDDGSDGKQRVRKRDVVANAVSGGLASGLGWVLGATPVNQ